MEFIDSHGNEVLNLGSFTLLPQHVVRLILAREEVVADEFSKFQVKLSEFKKKCPMYVKGSNDVEQKAFLEYQRAAG